MTDQPIRQFRWPTFIAGLVIIIAGLILINNWIGNKADDILQHPINTSTTPPMPSSARKQKNSLKKRAGEILRKTTLGPERTYEVSIFYQAGEVIARQRTSKGVVHDQSGQIPDGRVKFINENQQTYGVEFYRNGTRHGPSKTYYKEGPLRRDALYQYGKLMTSTEYYQDGIIRMSEDYQDARVIPGRREVGVGKVYFRNGTLKYEWSLTNSEAVSFSKSYNQKGEMTAAVYYDEYGDIIPPEEDKAL